MTKGYWYQARGKNCRTSTRTGCGGWSDWSNSIFLNTPPTFDETTYEFSVRENVDSGTLVGSVSATDPDTGHSISYSISGTDASSFTIVETSTQTETGGQIKTSADLDFETKNSYSVTATADDGHGGTDTIDVTINVTNVNEAPDIEGDFSPSHDENDIGIVETYTADDPEDDEITWTLEGDDAGAFTVSDGKLKFKITPDFENPHDSNPDDSDALGNNNYEITIKASDGDLATKVSFTVKVTDVRRAPGQTQGS